MEIAMSDVPLTLFTTLASIGAGAFLVIFVAIATLKLTDAQMRKLDQLTIIPILFGVVGMICAFFHLANPGNAFQLLNTIGSTPMANEIMWFSIFMVVAVIYWICALAGVLKAPRGRLILSMITAILAVIAGIFMGLAYMVDTIQVWQTLWSPAQMVGALFFGGGMLGIWLVSMADNVTADTDADNAHGRHGSHADAGDAGRGDAASIMASPTKAIVTLGAIVFVVSTIGIFIAGSGATSAMIDVAANAESLIAPMVISIILVAASMFCVYFGGRKGNPTTWYLIGVICAIIGTYLGRMVFYGMQISIGL
ncbi:MAG: dimethyl sulfoxide reductase anchor subunit [Eggerthellaceae bacterium]|nr:dimethyl sulfoxide reductase anchor subunit [Eggerthellaceae bacterium]